MPFNIGGGEALFLLVLVLIVFGAGRLPDVVGQLGKGVRSFHEAASSDAPSSSRRCTSCGEKLLNGARFCAYCGRPL